jgi:hypothetical protein
MENPLLKPEEIMEKSENYVFGVKFDIYFYQNFITVSWGDENDKR